MVADRAARFADTNLGYISIDDGKCNRCRHVYADGLRCKAFRKGIPMEILTGKFDHSTKFPGDHGIQFEPREEALPK